VNGSNLGVKKLYRIETKNRTKVLSFLYESPHRWKLPLKLFLGAHQGARLTPFLRIGFALLVISYLVVHSARQPIKLMLRTILARNPLAEKPLLWLRNMPSYLRKEAMLASDLLHFA
jgi:hypothetical protein